MRPKKVSDIRRMVRDRLFANLWPGTGLCFSLYKTKDAGPNQLGELFHQDQPFLMVEVRIDDVTSASPGSHTPRRVLGALEITYHSKSSLDATGAHHLLEQSGNWFAQDTIEGVRFREFIPTGTGRDQGFQFYSGTIVFEYKDSQSNVSESVVSSEDNNDVSPEGFRHKAGAGHPLHRNRIVDVIEGELPRSPIVAGLEQGGKSGGAMEILFVGFSAEEREWLQDDAESYGLLIRKTVTPNLDFVCAGPGASKLAKARAQGCTILNKDQFYNLVQYGVMPE